MPKNPFMGNDEDDPKEPVNPFFDLDKIEERAKPPEPPSQTLHLPRKK